MGPTRMTQPSITRSHCNRARSRRGAILLGAMVCALSAALVGAVASETSCEASAVENRKKERESKITEIYSAIRTIEEKAGAALGDAMLEDGCTEKLIKLGLEHLSIRTNFFRETAELGERLHCLALERYEDFIKCLCEKQGKTYSAEGYKFMAEYEKVYTKGPEGLVKMLDDHVKVRGEKVSDWYGHLPSAVRDKVPKPEGIKLYGEKVTLNPVVDEWIKRTGELRKCFDNKTLATIENVSKALESFDPMVLPEGVTLVGISVPTVRWRAPVAGARPAPTKASLPGAVPGGGEKGLVRGKSDITGIPEDKAKRELGPGARTVDEILFKPKKPDEKAPVESRRVGGVKVDVQSEGTPEDLSAARNEILKMRKGQ